MEEMYLRGRGTASSWLWQSFTGIALLLLVGLHMIANHFIAQGGIRDYAGVIDYLRNPVIVALEVLFLLLVTSHALLGVRSILFDLGLSQRTERFITGVMWVLGLLTIGYGLWLTWTITANL